MDFGAILPKPNFVHRRPDKDNYFFPVFPDLMGFGPVPPEHTVDWTRQIDVDGHPPAQRAKRIDSRLPSPLIALPTVRGRLTQFLLMRTLT